MLTDDFDFGQYAQLCLDQATAPWSYTAQDFPYDGAARTASGRLSVNTAVGNMRHAIESMGSGERMTMADGISVRRNDPGKGYDTQLTRGGFGRKTHGTSSQAAREMLDQSARNEHDAALGGRVHYNDAAVACAAMNSGKLDHGNPPYSDHTPADAEARFAEHHHYVGSEISRQRVRDIHRANGDGRILSQDGEEAVLDPRRFTIALSQARQA